MWSFLKSAAGNSKIARLCVDFLVIRLLSKMSNEPLSYFAWALSLRIPVQKAFILQPQSYFSTHHHPSKKKPRTTPNTGRHLRKPEFNQPASSMVWQNTCCKTMSLIWASLCLWILLAWNSWEYFLPLPLSGILISYKLLPRYKQQSFTFLVGEQGKTG